MIDLEAAEKALEFLADTDERYAQAKVNVERAQFLLRRKESLEFQSSEGNIPERQAIARTSESVLEAEQRLTGAMVAYETLKAQRETKKLIWEHFRTLTSARKAGMVI